MARPESKLQIACVEWFRLQYPQYSKSLVAIPNGAYLAGDSKRRAIQMKILKNEGLVEGASDLVLFLPTENSGVLHIEMKVEKRTKTGKVSRSQSRLSPNQKAFRAAMMAVGYKCIVCYNFDEFAIEVQRHILNHIRFKAKMS